MVEYQTQAWLTRAEKMEREASGVPDAAYQAAHATLTSFGIVAAEVHLRLALKRAFAAT